VKNDINIDCTRLFGTVELFFNIRPFPSLEEVPEKRHRLRESQNRRYSRNRFRNVLKKRGYCMTDLRRVTKAGVKYNEWIDELTFLDKNLPKNMSVKAVFIPFVNELRLSHLCVRAENEIPERDYEPWKIHCNTP